MDQQPELQWYMRSHLIEFLLEIHLHFRLRPETLFLTMSILDRYVSRRIVYKKHYQLVGCVSLWLAAKFEDAKERVPSVKDLNELCHGQYDDSSFAQMEHHVLATVDWDLGHPTPESWLRILCTETHMTAGMQPLSTGFGLFGANGALGSIDTPFEDMQTQHVARFLMELTLFGRDFVQFVPSMIALGALCLAREICNKPRRVRGHSSRGPEPLTYPLRVLLDRRRVYRGPTRHFPSRHHPRPVTRLSFSSARQEVLLLLLLEGFRRRRQLLPPRQPLPTPNQRRRRITRDTRHLRDSYRDSTGQLPRYQAASHARPTTRREEMGKWEYGCGDHTWIDKERLVFVGHGRRLGGDGG